MNHPSSQPELALPDANAPEEMEVDGWALPEMKAELESQGRRITMMQRVTGHNALWRLTISPPERKTP